MVDGYDCCSSEPGNASNDGDGGMERSLDDDRNDDNDEEHRALASSRTRTSTTTTIRSIDDDNDEELESEPGRAREMDDPVPSLERTTTA